MKKLAFGAVALMSVVTAVAPAQAQETESWTGPYVGGRAGYSWQPSDGEETLDFDTNLNGSYSDVVRTAAGVNAFGPGFCDGQAMSNAPGGGCRKDKNAVTYTGMIGYDVQIGSSPFVVGLVAEYGNANINDRVSGFSTTPASYTLTRSLRGTGAVRGRIGFAFQSTLLYGTAGGAYGKIRHHFQTSNATNTFTDNDGDDARLNAMKDDRFGYTFGGGFDQRVAKNFSIGALYSYTSLDDDDYRLRVGRGTSLANNPFLTGNSAGTNLRRGHSEFNRHDVTVTAAFRF